MLRLVDEDGETLYEMSPQDVDDEIEQMLQDKGSYLFHYLYTYFQGK